MGWPPSYVIYYCIVIYCVVVLANKLSLTLCLITITHVHDYAPILICLLGRVGYRLRVMLVRPFLSRTRSLLDNRLRKKAKLV